MGVFANTLLHRFFFSFYLVRANVRARLLGHRCHCCCCCCVVSYNCKQILREKGHERRNAQLCLLKDYSWVLRIFFFFMLLFRSFVCQGTVFARLKDCVRDDERERKVNHIDFTIEMPLNRSQLLYVCVVCERCVRCAPFDVFVLCVITINWSQISIFSFFFLVMLCFQIG